MSKVLAILTSDWHLREDQPPCRTDNFWETQWNKVDEISQLQQKYNCLVLHAGDLFHHWKPSPYLISTAIKKLPAQFHTVYGQHDLPNHSLELQHKSGIYALKAAGVLKLLKNGHWGQEPKRNCTLLDWTKVAVWHHFVWDGETIPWPGCDELTASQVLSKYKKFDLIVTGDHHKTFIKKVRNRWLVNPGCLTRQAADYANHKPVVFLYLNDGTVKPYYLESAPKDVVQRDHLIKKEETNKRLEAFISRLKGSDEVSLSFEDNLQRFIHSNKLKKPVVNLVLKAIEDEK